MFFIRAPPTAHRRNGGEHAHAQPGGADGDRVAGLLRGIEQVFDALKNYFSPDSGIAGTPGAILVIASTIFLLGFGLVMRGYAGQGRLFRALVTAFAFADIVGTALAGYLLDSETLVALMMVCLVGWLAHIFRPRPLLV